MKRIPEIIEQVFIILSLVLYSSGPLTLILSNGAEQVDENLINSDTADFLILRIVFIINYLITFLLIVIHQDKIIDALIKNWTIFTLTGIAIISVTWSSIPTLTQSHSVALFGSSLFGLYIGSRYNFRDQLRLLGWSFAIIIMMSFLFATVFPKYGMMPIGIHEGAWRGIYVHKNILGKVMVISTIVFWLLASNYDEKPWITKAAMVGLGLSFCLLILSKSSSSMINCIIILSLIPLYKALRWRYYLTIITTIVISSSLFWFINTNIETLLELIDKDVTLSGRTNMWPYILYMLQEHPWLGYGYNGFWNDWNSPGAYIWYAIVWEAPNSHNGLLDLWLELGLLGVIVFLIGFVQTLRRGIAEFRSNTSEESIWALLYLTNLVMSNLTESSLLNRNDIFWLLYVTISFSLFINPSKKSKFFN